MDEKKFECFAKGLYILHKAYWKKRGVEITDFSVFLADDPDSGLVWSPEKEGRHARAGANERGSE